jgi:hypothetical protein
MARTTPLLSLAAAMLVLLCAAPGAHAQLSAPNVQAGLAKGSQLAQAAPGQPMSTLPTAALYALLADADSHRPSSVILMGKGGRKLSQTAGLTCERQWFGTSPACRGECPEGWTEIKRAGVCGNNFWCNSIFYGDCGDCDGAYFGHACDAFSQKALCERCS